MSQTAEIINFKEKTIVKADTDNGFDMMAHELTKALFNPPVKLSGREYQIIMFLVSKTFRFHKSLDWITNSQIAEGTGISANHISELLSRLIEKNVVKKVGREVGINPLISDWINVNNPKNGSVKKSQKRDKNIPKMGVDNPENGINKSQKRDTHNKTTITKETITTQGDVEKFVLPDWIDKKTWLAFLEHRRRSRKPLTDHAKDLTISKLAEFSEQGYCPNKLLNYAIYRGWQTVFKPSTNDQASCMRGNPVVQTSQSFDPNMEI